MAEDLYLFDPGDSHEARRMREERDAAIGTVRGRWVERAAELIGIEAPEVDAVVAVLFDHADQRGGRCSCGCHPSFSQTHDGGFDCPCTWSAARREAEWANLEAAPWRAELRAAHRAEEAEIEGWLAGQTEVEARRTSTACPEQREGVVDGRSFYFRERHGEWRIELDLRPSGRFSSRCVGTSDDGRIITEPVELEEGDVIAQGVADALGMTPVDHLAFIVATIRDHVRRDGCPHTVGRRFCADCGVRIETSR